MNSNADVMWFLGIVGLFNFAALTFLAIRLRAPVQISVAQPNITVQAPNSILPPELLDLMQRLNEKLSPPTTPAEVAQLDQLVLEGVELASTGKGTTGPDKFRAAKAYVTQRASQLRLELDERSLALSIESAVAMRRAAQKLLPK